MQVMFRWEHETERVFVRRYGKAEWPEPIGHYNGTFNEATLYGAETARDDDLRGKP